MPLLDDPEAIVLMMPILLAGSEGFAEEMGIKPDEEERLLAQAADDIPLVVIGIDMFWKERRGADVEPRSRCMSGGAGLTGRPHSVRS